MGQVDEKPKPAAGWWIQAGTLTQIAVVVVIVTGAWFMLKELAVLLRPLLLAILLCYAVLPMHSRIRRDRSEFRTLLIMVGGALIVVVALGFLVYGSLASMTDELPRLLKRAQQMAAGSQAWSKNNLPLWLSQALNDLIRAEAKGAQLLEQGGAIALKYTADLIVEALIVGLYAIFLLLEVKRMRKRVNQGFDGPRAQQILATVQTINDGIANYLKAKVRASLILAAPVTGILFAFDVKFAILWGLLTFFCNFIPYVGSVIACGSPIVFGFLDLPLGWQPLLMSLLLLSCHIGSASFVEPTLIGKAVGLSPLVILMSLTFWGLCWGLVGMFLAVPLTVAMKIVLANIEATKGIAALLGDDG